jgi:predicted protein tyrosine phosphatase
MNIHFICRGNVLRSLIAETYLRSLELPNITVISSGTNVNWDDPLKGAIFQIRSIFLVVTASNLMLAKTMQNNLQKAVVRIKT